MLRRSARLQTNGYYNSEGVPVISYKETLYRVFKERKCGSRSFQRNPEPDVCDLAVYPEPEPVPEIHSEISSPRKTLRMFLLVVLFFCFRLSLTLVVPKEFSTTVIGKFFTGSSEDIWKDLKDLRKELKEIQEKMQFLWPDENNFAMEALGARIIYEKTTEPYPPEEPGLKLFGRTVISAKRPPPVSPRILLQDWTPMVPGKCWAFEGSEGHLSVELSHRIMVSHVSIGHVTKNVSPDEDTTSAPRMFSVFAKQNLEDPDIHLGTFQYLTGGSPLQHFFVSQACKRNVVKYLSLQIHSNWGNHQYTCMYRLRVHGKLALQDL